MVIPNCKSRISLPFHISILFLMKMNVTSTRCSQAHEMTHFYSWWRTSIVGYFPDLEDLQKYCRFVNNPFGTSVGDLLSWDSLLHEEVTVMVNDENARHLYSEKSCSDFKLKWHKPTLTFQKWPLALKVLIPFPTTYEWESAVSALLAIKPKVQSRNKGGKGAI